jgi:hypothetical protein
MTETTNYRSLDDLAAAIHAAERRSIFEIGALLLEAKAGHPCEFLTWLAEEFEYSEDTAERWMKVALLGQRFRNLRNMKLARTTLYIVRLLEDDECERLTADQLRAMIDECQTEPWAVMEQDGTLRLVNNLYRGRRSWDVENHEEEVRMFEDETFELIKEDE